MLPALPSFHISEALINERITRSSTPPPSPTPPPPPPPTPLMPLTQSVDDQRTPLQYQVATSTGWSSQKPVKLMNDNKEPIIDWESNQNQYIVKIEIFTHTSALKKYLFWYLALDVEIFLCRSGNQNMFVAISL